MDKSVPWIIIVRTRAVRSVKEASKMAFYVAPGTDGTITPAPEKHRDLMTEWMLTWWKKEMMGSTWVSPKKNHMRLHSQISWLKPW